MHITPQQVVVWAFDLPAKCFEPRNIALELTQMSVEFVQRAIDQVCHGVRSP
jgi:hypothetical protein